MLSTSVSSKRLELITGVEVVADGVRDGTAEDDKIEKRVGTETVGTVDGDGGGLTAGEETRDDLVVASLVDGKNLTSVASGDTTHVVVNGRKDGDGLLADIDTGKDTSSLRDTGETLSKNLGGKMAQLEVDVVLLGTDTTAVTDLHGHGTGDDVTRSKILGGRGITLHETLTLGVEEVTTLTTGALSDQAAGTVDTSRVELNKLEILVGETGTGSHGHTVTSASVGGSAAEVGTSVSTSGEDGVVGEESVEGAVLLVVGENTAAFTILHDQVEGEVLDEVVGVVSERLAVEGVEKGVAGTVSSSAAAVGLATLAELLGLTTESTLVATLALLLVAVVAYWRDRLVQEYSHLALLGTGEGAAVVLEFDDGGGSLTGHVVDSVLVTKPVGALDGIVHVPSPVVLVHVAKGGVDTTLSSDSVGSGREELGDTGSVEASLGETKGSTETGTAGTDDDGIVLVVLFLRVNCQFQFYPVARRVFGWWVRVDAR